MLANTYALRKPKVQKRVKKLPKTQSQPLMPSSGGKVDVTGNISGLQLRSALKSPISLSDIEAGEGVDGALFEASPLFSAMGADLRNYKSTIKRSGRNGALR